MAALSKSDIDARLKGMDGWALAADEIAKTYTTKDFLQAMEFVNRVAEAAQAADHHPDILIQYNKVTLTLSTHSEGGVTDKDFALAAAADGLA